LNKVLFNNETSSYGETTNNLTKLSTFQQFQAQSAFIRAMVHCIWIDLHNKFWCSKTKQ